MTSNHKKLEEKFFDGLFFSSQEESESLKLTKIG